MFPSLAVFQTHTASPARSRPALHSMGIIQQRSETYSTTFATTEEYFLSLRNAVNECILITIGEVALKLYPFIQKNNRTNGHALEYAAWKSGIGLHTGLEILVMRYPKPLNSSTSSNNHRFMLKLVNKEPASAYNKDDLWVISSTLEFSQSECVLCRSTWHGPSSQGTSEIDLISEQDNASMLKLSKSENILAVRLCNASSELLLVDRLDLLQHRAVSVKSIHCQQEPDLQRFQFPLQNFIANPTKRDPALLTYLLEDFTYASRVEEVYEDSVKEFSLNDDQSRMLRQTLDSVAGNCSKTAPITLCHGVFGAGKSFLLAVMIISLFRLFYPEESMSDEADSDADEKIEEGAKKNRNGTPRPIKILFSSNTNIAVDRVLISLKEMSFQKFVRVGSLRRISRSIYSHTVQLQNGSNDIEELQRILRDDSDLSDKEIEDIQDTIKRFKSQNSMRLLNDAFVVGTTCLGCHYSLANINDNNQLVFPIVILDECSQITEPMSLLPLAGFVCRRAILVGDPLQLPPTLPQASIKAPASGTIGLDITLFERLQRCGLDPVMLRTQYRCHPKISQIANSLFYSSQLQNGVTSLQRSPLHPSIPTVSFFNVSNGREKQSGSGSFYNDEECIAIVRELQKFVSICREDAEDLEAEDVGVISLYKLQASKISLAISNCTGLFFNNAVDGANSGRKKSKVTVSTVDAFQGGEKEIIFLSTVRSNNTGAGVGFTDEPRRLNVALTRARRHLIIFGHRETLSRSELWRSVLTQIDAVQ